LRPEFYSEYRQAEERHWWFQGRRRILLSVLEGALPAGATAGRRRILDVGCGSGMMLGELTRYGDAFGVDSSEEALAACRSRGLEQVQRAQSPPLPFEPESFDVITAFDVLEHLDDDTAMLGDLHRLLKPSGLLLVTVPAYKFLWGPHDEINEHRRRYTAAQLRRGLTGSGFRPTRTTYFNTLLFAPIAAVRLGRRLRRSKAKASSDLAMTPHGLVDVFLARVFALEAVLLRRLDLPFGVSVLATATRG
jgi:SAM-dependent methyltransferase